MGRDRARRGKAAADDGQGDGVKVTMLLPYETARKLRAVAAWRGVQLGQVVAPALDASLSSWYVAERTARPAERPRDPAASEGEPPRLADVEGGGVEAA